MRKIVIIGGGASGLMAGYSASLSTDNQVVILEKNEKIGKKIYITGKGRCNLSNDVPTPEFFNFVVNNPKFLYSSIYNFTPLDTYNFFENNGLPLKIERGNRVFPLSDKSSDVIKTLEKAVIKNGVKIYLNTEVTGLIVESNKVVGVKTNEKDIFADSVIICTGGISYPLTGSTGDGYKFAKKTGHNVIKPVQALCGIEVADQDVKELQGLALKNVKITALNNQKNIYEDFGELLFTHFGVSGPIVLSCSSMINRLEFNKILLKIDLKPALIEDMLENRLVREIESLKTSSINSLIRKLAPQSLTNVLIKRLGVSKNRKCCEITKQERENIIYLLKNFTLKVKSLRPFSEAIITSGGIDVKNINPKTLESKIIKNLFFAGEVIDVDAYTGGFNLQIAFSTGYTAGQNA